MNNVLLRVPSVNLGGAAVLSAAAAMLSVAGTASPAAARINVPTATVGNPGNAPENTVNGPFGGVAYSYKIGSTEVTNAQYAEFLSAVASTDTYGLYNTNMAGSMGGITQGGFPGSHIYSTIPGRENHPVNFVSFWDTARFANWMHNGQPGGLQNNATTEDGAYTLTTGGISANTITRNAGWQWAVSNSNEWYKAAYHQPASQGGDADNYWLYPTSSNTAPTLAQAHYHILPAPIPTDTVPVASYGANFYGTYDMGGNVYEWSDTLFAPIVRGPLWGGAFDNVSGWLTPGSAYIPPPFEERAQIGFRVVTQVPAPSAAALLGLGAAMTARRRRQRA